MNASTQLAIIGAGPAGLAAAETATAHGIDVTVLDENAYPGGQIWRGIAQPGTATGDLLGDDAEHARTLVNGLDHPGIRYLSGAMVWDIDEDHRIRYSREGQAATVQADHILIATGAMERPMPFEGWTLPGVMTAGAAQILLKTAATVPQGRTVLAGNGPLLYLLANQLIESGCAPAALLDTTRWSDRIAGARHLPTALTGMAVLKRGHRLLRSIRRAKVPWISGVNGLRANGDGRIAQVRFRRGGTWSSLDADHLLVHCGVVPNVQLTRVMGLAQIWHDAQHCWHPSRDAWGESSRNAVFIAGDGGGIGGARAAELQGRLAALQIAHFLEALTQRARDAEAAHIRRALGRELSVRPLLDAHYPPAKAFLDPSDETIVCRCEEVRAGEVRRHVAGGCLGPNQIKAFSRCGMGPCQGQLCGLTVSHIIASARGVPVDEVGAYRVRPPIKPVTLGEIAAADASGEAVP